MTSKLAAVALISALALAGCATGGANGSGTAVPQRYVLKDGDILYVDSNGTMRMFKPCGERIYMKGGEPMVLADGTVIVMKENPLWKVLRMRGTLGPRG